MTPGSPEWAKLVTASKVAAILGVSPWESQRSIWHKMRGDVPAEESNEVQRRGHYLEPAILSWWRDQHGVDTDPFHWRDQPEYRLGDWAAATPDAFVEDKNVGPALVEAKSAAYDDDWGDPGTDQIPTYYLTQVYFQMEVSGIHRTYVPIITSRLRFAEYVVDHDPAIGADLVQRMRAFYDSLTADEPPPLDDSVATFDVIRKLHPGIEPKVEVEVSEFEAKALLEACLDYDEAEATIRHCKATVLAQMGRAQYATCNGVRIARRQPNKGGVSFVPLPKNLPLLTIEEAS